MRKLMPMFIEHIDQNATEHCTHNEQGCGTISMGQISGDQGIGNMSAL